MPVKSYLLAEVLLSPMAGWPVEVASALWLPVFSAVSFFVALLFLAACFTVLFSVACTFLDVAVVAAGALVVVLAALEGVAAPVCANTGNVSADNSAAAMREVDFMAIFLKEKFFSFGALSSLFGLIAAPYFH